MNARTVVILRRADAEGPVTHKCNGSFAALRRLRMTAALAMLLTLPLHATTLRVFGSAGAESQLTPANTASPLNPRNVAQIPMTTNVSPVRPFAEIAAAMPPYETVPVAP